MVQPIFPGVGTRSRIADVIQRDNELSLRQEALNRQSGQDLLGLGVSTALGVGSLVEQAERAARERELRAEEGRLDRLARGELGREQIAGREAVAFIGTESEEEIARQRQLGFGARQVAEQKFLGGESGLERAARLKAQGVRGELDIGLERSRRAGALEVAEEGTFGRLAATDLAGVLAAEEGVRVGEREIAAIQARGEEARALQVVQQAGSVVLQGMQDSAAGQRLIATLESRIELAIVNNDLALERQLQSEKARLVEIDSQRAADFARFAAQFQLEQTAASDPIKRMEDRAFVIEDTFNRGEASGTIAPGTAGIRIQEAIEAMVLENPEAAALSEILRPTLQRALNRQALEVDAQVPAAQRAAERRERADFIRPLPPPGTPGVPNTLGLQDEIFSPPTGNRGLGPSIEGRRREASATARLNPLTGEFAPLSEDERIRRGIQDFAAGFGFSSLGRPQRSALPGRQGTRGINTIQAGGEGLLDFIQGGFLGLNQEEARRREIGEAVGPASPAARVVRLEGGGLGLVLPGGQIIPIPEDIPTQITPVPRGTLPGFPGLNAARRSL